MSSVACIGQFFLLRPAIAGIPFTGTPFFLSDLALDPLDILVVVIGVPVAAANEDTKDHAWIFSASAKHRFSEDLMVYASFGSSWRPGPATNPIILREVTWPSRSHGRTGDSGSVKNGRSLPPIASSSSCSARGQCR